MLNRDLLITALGFSECDDGHATVLHNSLTDCPVCKEISKRLTEVNVEEVKLALAENKISILEGTIDSLNAKKLLHTRALESHLLRH
jgi:hypothetical protein